MAGVPFVLTALLIALLLVPFVPAPALGQMTVADVHVAQAIVDFDEKRYEAAIENLQRALALDPNHVEALYYMGATLMAQDRSGDAVPFLLRARQRAPTDWAVAFQLGLAHFAQQRFEEAQRLLEEVFRTQPGLDGLGYYVGFLRYRQKDYRGAVEAFRAARVSSPELRQLTQFYAGLALAMLGQPAQAVAEVERALQTAPGSPLTGPAERLRDTIVATRARERRFSAELRLGGFFDDNVAVVPDRDASDSLTALLRQRRHETFGQLVGLRLEVPWLRYLVARDDWDATVGYSFFATVNNDVPGFDVRNHLLNAGLTYRTALGRMPFQIGTQYAFDTLDLDGRSFLDRHTATIFAVLAARESAGWVPGHLTQAFARFQDKDFKGALPVLPICRGGVAPCVEQDRDAQNYMVGILHLFRFQNDLHFVKVGYQFDWDDTRGRDFEYLGHRVVAGVQVTLPWNPFARFTAGDRAGIRLRYDFDTHRRDYQDAGSSRFLRARDLAPGAPGGPLTRRRLDQEFVNIVRAEIPVFSTCVTRADCIAWTLSAEYQRTDVRSNIPIFEYSRSLVSLILSLSY